MTFRPSIHGWPFDNARSWDPSALGLGASPLPELGLSGGMCWAALDRYLAGVEIARDVAPPGPAEPLHAELIRRQVAALSGVWERVRDWQGPDPDGWRARIPGAGRGLARRSRAEWRRVRRRLNAGEPVLLTVLPEADGYSRGRAAWQLLATGWTKDGGRVRLSIYDPGRPGDDAVHLSFRRRGPLDARLTGGQALRGFFMVAYDRRPGPTLRAETFADRSVIGLNRKVRGGLSAVVHGARLDLVGRDPDSALVHFRRGRRDHWEGATITDPAELGSHELHSDPQALLVGGRLHVFARSYVGDLLHFRRGRSWEVINVTDQKRTGARFRLAGVPVPLAGRRGTLSVVGRDREGGLIHYRRTLLRGWTAEQVAGEPIAGDPRAMAIGDTLHVVAVTGDRRLLAWERSEERSWVRIDLSTGLEAGPSVRVSGRPTLLAHDGTLHIFARDRDDRLVHFQRAADDRWSAAIRADGATGDAAATRGPAGIHVFAPAGDHGLIHLWGCGPWEWENVVGTRPSLGGGAGWTGPISAWGSASELRVFGRQGPRLMVFAWRPDTDWTATPLDAWAAVDDRHRPMDDPLVLADGTGAPHLFATDGRGSVIHVEPGDWVEPGTGERPRPRRHAPIPAKPVPAPAGEGSARPDEAPAQAPAEVLTETPAAPAPATVAAPEEDPAPLPLLGDDDLDLPDAADPGEDVDPLPLLADPEPEEVPAATTLATDLFHDDDAPEALLAEADAGALQLDRDLEGDLEGDLEADLEAEFEAYLGADLEGDLAVDGDVEQDEIEVAAEAAAEAADANEPDVAAVADEAVVAHDAVAADEAADAGEDEDTDPLPLLELADEEPAPAAAHPPVEVATNGNENGNGNGAVPGRKEFRWEHVAESGERVVEDAGAGAGAEDMEPMDLTLLDSWPPKTPLRTGSSRDAKKGARKGGKKGRGSKG